MKRFGFLNILFLSCLVVAVVVIQMRTGEQKTDFSSTARQKSGAAAGSVECPSPEEIEKFQSEYNLEISKENFSCANNDARTQLYKTLVAIDRGSYKVPTHWGPEFAGMAVNIKNYIQKYVKKISLSDQAQTSTVVNSYPSEKWIEFTDRILELNPVEMLAMLVHEVRHIEAPQRGHVLCGPGDMPGTSAACDEILMSDYKNMSSYNIEAYYSAGLAMFNNQFNESEKNIAAQSALKLMASRFNNFKDNTAYFHDVIYKLTDDRELQVWHTYLKKWMPIQIRLSVGDRIDHIETANDAFKISIFTEQGRFLTYSPIEGSKVYSESLTGAQVSDATRVVVPNSGNDNYMAVVVSGKAKLLSFKNKLGLRQLVDYPFVKSDAAEAYKFKKIIYGFFNEVFFMDENGNLFRKSQEKNQIPDLFTVDVLDAQGPWLAGTAGLTFEDLFFTNQKGQLFQLAIKNKRSPEYLLEDEFKPEYFELKRVDQWMDVPVKKFIQGAFGDYVLNSHGEILLKRHSGSTGSRRIEKFASADKVRDFTVMKMLVPTGLIAGLFDLPLTDFKAKCHLVKASLDPILYKGMGLNSDGHLVFLDTAGNCAVYESADVFTDYKFMNVSTLTEKTYTDFLKNGMNFMSDVVLEIVTKSKRIQFK